MQHSTWQMLLFVAHIRLLAYWAFYSPLYSRKAFVMGLKNMCYSFYLSPGYIIESMANSLLFNMPIFSFMHIWNACVCCLHFIYFRLGSQFFYQRFFCCVLNLMKLTSLLLLMYQILFVMDNMWHYHNTWKIPFKIHSWGCQVSQEKVTFLFFNNCNKMFLIFA